MSHSPARRGLGVGSVVKDTYTLGELIGRGGMGEVYAAVHNDLGKRVAIKILHADLADEDVLKRFKREARIAAELAHPNIVDVDDVGVSEGVPYLVLEYLAGESLAARITKGPLTVERTLTILRQVGSGLAAAHRAKIVHRDLKPQNIYLVATERDGRADEVAKVLDFGISKILGSSTVKTQESSLLGTPQYMAPEQALGHHSNVDERTDIFALGVIAYEMLTGTAPFTGASIPEVVFKVVYEQPIPLATAAPHTPPHVVAAIERAMAKKANERFATVNELIEALTGEALGRSLPPAVRPPPTEAYAATVDSGAGVARAPEPVSGHASTVISQNTPQRLDGPPAVAPTQLAPSQNRVPSQNVVPTIATPAPPKRARWPFIAGALLALGGVAVAAVMLADRGDPPAPPPADPTVASVKITTGPEPAPRQEPVAKVEPPQAAPPTAAPPTAEPPKAEPKTDEPKTDEPKKAAAVRKRPEPAETDPLGDPTSTNQYDQLAASAMSLMQKGDWRSAISVAQKIEYAQDAPPRHRQTAFFVAAMSYCAGLNNPGVGKPYVKLIKSRPRRAQAATACGPGFGGGKKS